MWFNKQTIVREILFPTGDIINARVPKNAYCITGIYIGEEHCFPKTETQKYRDIQLIFETTPKF